MAAKIEKKNHIPAWHGLTNNINKQLFEINDLGQFDYNIFQDSWLGYTKRINEEMNKVIKLDEKQYNNMVHFWREFNSSINTEVTKLINFEKENYNLIYNNLLMNIDKNSNELYEKMINQTIDEPKIFELFEKALITLGYTESQTKQLVRISKTLVDLSSEAYNSTRTLINNSVNPDITSKYFNEAQKLIELWMVSYPNVVKQLTDISQLEAWQEFYQYQNQLILNMAEKSFKTFFDHFSWIRGDNRDRLLTEFHELKDKFDELLRDPKEYDESQSKSLKNKIGKSED